MGRDSYNPKKNARMGNNSQKNKDVANAAKQVGVSKEALSKLLHGDKNAHYDGDYSYKELVSLAQEVKKKEEKKQEKKQEKKENK